MKKIYLLAGVLLFAAASFAQSVFNGSSIDKNRRVPLSVPVKLGMPPERDGASFQIDYDYYEFNLFGAAASTPGSGYRAFIWDTNFNYTTADSSQKYTIVAFDSIYDVYADMGYPFSTFSSIRVDSIWANVGHMNQTGNNDTLQFKIINLLGSNHPGTTVYNTTEIIATNITTGASWLNSEAVGTGPAYTLPAGVKKFGIKMEYHGNPLDTLGIVTGFNDFGGPCGSGSYLPVSSVFFPNSYQFMTQYASYGIIPTAPPAGADFYYDCNSSGGLDAGDGKSTYQNAGIWVKVTLDPTGIDEEYAAKGIRMAQNEPNPFNKNSIVRYELAKSSDVNFSVYDVTGKKVMEQITAKASPGEYSINMDATNFNKGVYFYTLTANGNQVTKRMVITE